MSYEPNNKTDMKPKSDYRFSLPMKYYLPHALPYEYIAVEGKDM